MSENQKTTEISEIGEFGLITELCQFARQKNKSTITGIGDDAAIINHGNLQTVVTTDLLMEGIHFDLIYTPLMHLGYKAVVVNLSDIYAMMAKPTSITLSLGLSSRFSVEAVKELYKGIEKACSFYEVDLIGGDISASLTGLTISVTALGTVEEGKAVHRSGAKVDDLICVSGDLGAAYLGLQILEREKQVYLDNKEMQPELEQNKYIIERILKPEARRDIVEQLQKVNIQPTSMIDISDGLSSELMHICVQSQVGCKIYDENIPVHKDAIETAIIFNIDPSTCAMNGGEDYELLFTVSKEHLDVIEDMFDVRVIGKISEKEAGKKLVSKSGNEYDLTAQGWQSFKATNQKDT